MAGEKKILILGASGLSGRALVAELEKHSEWDFLGTAFTRSGPSLVALDIRDQAALKSLLLQYKPSVVVNCIAERRPDVVDKEPEKARALNVLAVESLAKLSVELGFWLLHLSTDYVFDGTSPPYRTTDATNPLNDYGLHKLQSEEAVKALSPFSAVLRVPVLYGPTDDVSESAVTVLANDVIKGKPKKVDDWGARFPTNVKDVAVVVCHMISHYLTHKRLQGLFHFCSKEKPQEGVPYTKYTISLLMADILGVSHTHLTPDSDPPAGGAKRPKNCELDISELESLLGIDLVGLQTPLAQGLREALSSVMNGGK